MKKKILFIFMFVISCLSLSACGKTNLSLKDYLIEKRENLFVASDELYNVNLSTGSRENEYNFDGIVHEHVPFAILTLSRNNNLPLANDTYTYIVTINDQTLTGFLEKNINDNSYSADLEVSTIGDEMINVQISFTGYTFNQDLENMSKNFQVDCETALEIADKELADNLEQILEDKNVKIEVVMKIMKDHSQDDLKNYYWYVGAISTNGDTLGILIDANNGEIIAKKV